ncbi:SHOCT domain-containing protein [bacterium]|nr:SHOCT domain-containing protein [Akkermansiaceae bacterium]MDB4762090.1 SHOCT domain-containing protein [bacterium]
MNTPDNDWRSSPGHFCILKRFVDPSHYRSINPDYYGLQETTEAAINRWLDEGIIMECDLPAKVSWKYTIPELKKLLGKHGAPASGNKSVLVERACDVASEEMEKHTKSIQLWQCTLTGMRALEEYDAAEAAAKSDAICKCYEALLQKDIKKTCKAHYKYEKIYTLNQQSSSAYQWVGESLQFVLQSRPSALVGLDDEQWSKLQARGALKKLWRQDTQRKQASFALPADLTLPEDNIERAIDFVLALASNQEDLKRQWTESVTIRFIEYDPEICDSCKALDGKAFKKEDVPEIPTPDCTNPKGCRCNFEPVDDEEGDEALEVGFFEEIESDETALPPLEAMKQLKEMADSGLITEEDFQEKKKEILSRM